MAPLTPHNLALAAALVLSAITSVTTMSIPDLSPRGVSGINCDGSGKCGLSGRKGLVFDPLLAKINQIPQNATYTRGQQLACAVYTGTADSFGNNISDGGGICASVCENTESILIGPSTNEAVFGTKGLKNSASDVIQDLVDHGCEACGTAPYVRVRNDLSKGCISVNYVTQVCYSVNDKPCDYSV